ncbi:MAG: DNA recombination protein RmuC [Halioglobus sp.]
MTLNADTLILAGMAFVVCVIIGLMVSVFRGVRARRALRKTRNRLEEAVRHIADLNQTIDQSEHEKELESGRVQAELSSLHTRLADREQTLAEQQSTHQKLSAEKDQLRDSLAQLQADNRGQSVALEQVQLQRQEKLSELAALKVEHTDLGQRLTSVLEEHAHLQAQQAEREEKHKDQLALLNETKDNLKKEFENLANKIFEDKGKSFTSTSQASLEAMLKPFREQITGFQSRINEVHTESVKGNAALESEIKKVLDVGLEMNSQASNLTTALKGDKKTTGNWGEAQLQRTLELAGLQQGEHYQTQAAFRDDEGKRKLPDFIIMLPDGKNLVIDSKVSLVDYDRAIAADTDEERTEALNAHAQAVRNHINDLSSKEYANLPDMGSPDFVLMFMPVEPAYIEAMKHNKDLFNYGYEKGVVMVSHTTLMPILRTVANLWMVEQSNREAKEISNRAGEIYNQVCLVAERLQKLGNTLRAANNHYNDTVRGLAGKQGLHGKVERFSQVSKKATKSLPTLEPLHEEIESDRLESLGLEAEAPLEPPPASNVKPIQPEQKT